MNPDAPRYKPSVSHLGISGFICGKVFPLRLCDSALKALAHCKHTPRRSRRGVFDCAHAPSRSDPHSGHTLLFSPLSSYPHSGQGWMALRTCTRASDRRMAYTMNGSTSITAGTLSQSATLRSPFLPPFPEENTPLPHIAVPTIAITATPMAHTIHMTRLSTRLGIDGSVPALPPHKYVQTP